MLSVEGGYKPTKLQVLIDDFIEANIPVAIVEYDEKRDVLSVYQSLWKAIKRLNCTLTVSVRVINDRAYLVNNKLIKELEEANA